MKKFILTIFLLVLSIGLVACRQESTGSNGKGSYAIIVIIRNKEYNFHSYNLDKKLEIGNKIGIIKRKLAADEYPKQLESNFFTKGTEIFEIKGTDEFIIAVDKTNKEHEKVVLKKVRNIQD